MLPQNRIRLANYPFSALSNLTYNQGEIVYDDTNGTIRLLDGQTKGGIPFATQAWATNAITQAVDTVQWPVQNTAGANGPAQIAIGNLAGSDDQGQFTIAIGNTAGANSQSVYGIAIGSQAGNTSQGEGAIGIGFEAGHSNQGIFSVGVGWSAGQTNQGYDAVAVGAYAGGTNQSVFAVAVGNSAGQINQGTGAVSLGFHAGTGYQSEGAIAIGNGAGSQYQGQHAISIGYAAGGTSQGANSIAIGANAGSTSQGANSIIISATGNAIGYNQANSCYIAPIRNDATNVTNILYYNTTSNELTYAPFPTSGVTAGTYSLVTVNSQGIVTSGAALTTAASLTSFGASNVTTTANGNLIVSGNLTVNGTVTTVNSTTVNTAEKVLVISSGATTDAQANASGIQVNGTTTKTLEWLTANSAWNSSENFNIATGKAYEINSTSVLTATTLGSTVVNSSLTSVGTIGTGVWQGSIVQPTYGGTGASTLAGANIPVTTVANTFTGTQTFSGGTGLSSIFNNIGEVVQIGNQADGTYSGSANAYLSTGSVKYYNTGVGSNWNLNITFNQSSTLNSVLTVGQSVTLAMLVTQGATAYYNTAIYIDNSISPTVYWQGGTAPVAGNASGIDVYNYTIIKTANNAFTVLASLSKF